MSDSEMIKKRLRSVLQTSKDGMCIKTLQSAYWSLLGENIPLKELGYSSLVDYLRSIPSVVRLEPRMGELKCFGVVSKDTIHVAELVARQRISNKSGRSRVVNCRLRFKATNPYMLNVRSRSPLRQPRACDASNCSRPHGGNRSFTVPGNYRQSGQRSPAQQRQPAPEQAVKKCTIPDRNNQSFVGQQNPREPPEQVSRLQLSQSYDLELLQRRITELLKKYCCGVWMSKVSVLYSEMFKQEIHPQLLIDLKKWTHICMVEPVIGNVRGDSLIYPPLPPKFLTVSGETTNIPPDSPTKLNSTTTSLSSETIAKSLSPHSVPKHRFSHQSPLAKPTFIFPPDPVSTSTSRLLISGNLRSPAHNPALAPKLSPRVNLSVNANGGCKNNDLHQQECRECKSPPLPSGVEVVGPVFPARLVLPSEQYPSVLVADAKNSNTVTIRYIGGDYSDAQEAMEDAMRSFYNDSSINQPVSNPVVGQLVAVRGEDGDELARAQVTEVLPPNKVKLYYLDHGFSVETIATNILDLQQDFLSLPFQAINVRLAGLEAFSCHPLVLSTLDKLAVGKILLMETLEPCTQSDMHVAVLYDTSQDDDININSACLKGLQDETMNNPLNVNTTYADVCVTNVCADGAIYCQLPSIGTARLRKLLEETEAFFISQMTSESLVSRPYSGMFCLARCKGKWSRVKITNLHGNRVMEVLFIDLGVKATVEVTALREIPLLAKDLMIIPPQAVKCCLADLTFPEGDWSPDAVLWVKEAVMSSNDCKMKILKLDEHKGERLVHMYLFIGADSQEQNKSINHQLAQSELWQKLSVENNNNTVTGINSISDSVGGDEEKLTLSGSVVASTHAAQVVEESSFTEATTKTILPPQLELPLHGQNMDVYVPVACHPGYFVLQPWQDLHKLVVLMGEMVLYYNQTLKTTTAMNIQKGGVYAAKIDKSWHRVMVKRTLVNGLVSVDELDHGKQELVHSSQLRPLIEEFRQLPFQAITAQLAGVPHCHWSDEASMLFRNLVEKKALVAQVVSVQEVSGVKGQLQERSLTVYLVDTGSEDKDLWIHSLMANIDSELSSAW